MKKLLSFLFIACTPPAMASFGSLPNCDQVDDVISQILSERSYETGVDLTLKSISYQKEVKLSGQDSNVRFCSAIMQTPIYKLDAIYSISPHSNGQYWVQLEEATPIMDQETMQKSKNQMNNQLAEERLKAFELAKKHGDMNEACTSLRVAKQFFLDANNEEMYIKTNKMLKEFCK